MSTRVVFTGEVDHRYAWIGNDAEGSVDIFVELAAVISAAASSIAVSTMTFNYGTGAGATPADAKVEAVAVLLSQKASAGVDVRIMGNGGHRYQAGFFRAQRGGAHVADNNLPALVHRISFQRSAAAPPGFLLDDGAVFGPRGGGLSYGWDQDLTGSVGPKGAPDATFTSPLLRECYALSNASGTRTWSIALPAGHYYVLVCTGEAAFGSKSIVRAQGQTIFTRKSGGVFQYFAHTDTGPGEFACSTVDGGSDAESGLPMSRRLEVTAASGRLDLAVGMAGEPSWSSVNYVEIYRASDTHSLGDPGLDPTRVQERALHHTKFVLVDAASVARKLWTGSHNLTPVDPAAADPRSEDAVITDEAAICTAFQAEMDQWWGAPSGAPSPAAGRNGIFKTPVLAGGVDLFQTISDFLGPSGAGTDDVLLMMEQLTDGGTYVGSNGTFPGATALVALLQAKVSAGTALRAIIGDSSPTESIFTTFTGVANAAVQSWARIHDKAALVDALHDNPTRARGKVLCGSMNWSQGAMHVNDEQTLILGDPALANQFLQRALKGFEEAGIELVQAADCVLVIDRSYSMNDPAVGGTTKIAAARNAAKVFLDMLNADGSHRVALVRFGTTVEPFAPPSTLAPLTVSSRVVMSTAIDGIAATLPLGNSTCYGRALQEALALLTTPSAMSRRLVVFLTDGKENTPPMASTVYPAMASAGIEIHTTSFGTFGGDASGPNAILAEMALASGGSFGQVDDDTIHLQKRFASVARDAMGMITILDPSWTLAPGAAFAQPFPVDMRRGTLLIVLLWGGQAGPREVKITTPWRVALTARSPGVSRSSGEGHEILRIDLGALGRSGREVRGVWSVSARAPKGAGAGWRVELCVFASDTGPGRLVTDLRLKGASAEVMVRAFAGPRLAEQVKWQVAHVPPALRKGDRVLRRKPAALRLTKVPSKARGFEGVSGAKLEAPAPGVHELRIVVEGTAQVEAGEKSARATLSVPFRREQRVSWFVPEGGRASGNTPAPAEPRRITKRRPSGSRPSTRTSPRRARSTR